MAEVITGLPDAHISDGRRVTSALLPVTDAVAAALLAADLAVVIYSVLARSLFNAPVEWADDIARGLMVASAFFGAASALARGENPGVIFFRSLLPPVWQRFADDVGATLVLIVAAYVAQNNMPAVGVAELIKSVHGALADINAPPVVAPERRKPAVPISRSVQHEFIVCLEDGKKLKMLKRYLRSRYDLSPEEYRRRWGLPPEYPMVAPAYAARRSDFAKKIGLGRGVRRGKV